MNTHDSALAAIAATLEVSHVHELAQLSDEAFWNYVHTLAGMIPAPPEQAPVKRNEEYLECVSAPGRFLLPLSTLYGIVPSPGHYTNLPGKPAWVAGLTAWRGTAIVVVDLPLYLTGSSAGRPELLPPESLLIASAGDVLLGLLVHSHGNILPASDTPPVPFTGASDGHELGTTTVSWYLPARQKAIVGIYADAFVLDVPALLTDIVRQIEMTATYG